MDLLGVKVEVYSHSIMENIVITNIEWDDSDRTSAEIYISDSVGSKWKLCRKYMTKRDAKAFNTTGIIEYVE